MNRKVKMNKKVIGVGIATVGLVVTSFGAGMYTSGVQSDKVIQKLLKDKHKIEQKVKTKEGELKFKSEYIKQLEDEHRLKNIELESIKGNIINMSKIIEDEAHPRVSKEFAEDLAKHIWTLNSKFEKDFGFKFDPYKTLAMIKTESSFNTQDTSHVGAKGLMQLMDATGKAYADKLGITEYKPYDWKQNIEIGWYYYNVNKEKHGEDKAIVAYNQGYKNLEGAVIASRGSSTSYLTKVKNYENDFKTRM